MLFSGFGVLCFALHLLFPTNLHLASLGHWLGLLYVPLSFCPALAFVINLFFILLSGRSAVGNMSVGGLKPHVLGELDLGICFILSPFDILKWKATEISSFVLVWILVSFFSIFMFFRSCFCEFFLKPLRARFLAQGCRHVPWRSNPVYSLASSSLHCA